jgi:superfamily II helicase
MNQSTVLAAPCRICNNLKLVSELIKVNNDYICIQCAEDQVPLNYDFMDISVINKPKKIITR